MDDKIDYLKQRAIEYQNKADIEKAKVTDDHDAPLREHWSYTASYRAMQVLMKQITDSNYQSV